MDEVANGNLGYTEAAGYANTRVRQAVIAGETNGHGYGILSAITQNAILDIRDMHLRSGYYEEQKNNVYYIIADLITAVQSGKAYEEAVNEAYTRIYQSVNFKYSPNTEIGVDKIYLDVPTTDAVMFRMARKLLLEAIPQI